MYTHLSAQRILHPHTRAGKWTVQQAADLGVAAPTIAASLDARYMSAAKPERVAASQVCNKPS